PVIGGLTLTLFIVLTVSLIIVSISLEEADTARAGMENSLSEARTQERRAIAARRDAESESRRANREAVKAGAAAEQARTAAGHAREEAHRARVQAYRPTLFLAQRAIEDGDYQEARRLLEATESELRGWEWRHLQRYLPVRLGAMAPIVKAPFVDISPDGKRLAGQSGGNVFVYDLNTGAYVNSVLGSQDMVGYSCMLKFDASGERLFAPIRPRDMKTVADYALEIVDLKTKQRLPRLKNVWLFGASHWPDLLPVLHVGPSEKGTEAWETLLNVPSGEEREIWRGPPDVWYFEKRELAVSADGKHYSRRTDKLLEYRRVEDDQPVEQPLLEKLRVGFDATSSDGKLVAGRAAETFDLNGTRIVEGSFLVIDLERQVQLSRLESPPSGQLYANFARLPPISQPQFRFSHDGKYAWAIHHVLVSMTAYFWETATGRYLGKAQVVAVSPSGTEIASLEGMTVVTERLPWDQSPILQRLHCYPSTHYLTWLPNGVLIGTSEYPRQVKAPGAKAEVDAPWLPVRQPGITLIECDPPQPPGPAVVHPDSGELIFARNYPVIHFVDPETAKVVRKLELAAPPEAPVKGLEVRSLLLLREPLRLATVHRQDLVRLWDLEDGRLLDTIEVKLGQQMDADVAPDGRHWAVGAQQGAAVFDGSERIGAF
ncbi:MAG TPA: hypothetical protein VHC19_22265, partial [Pirellulales bacterium]|nr:hypothetical protein [Pirellulales bacterium]